MSCFANELFCANNLAIVVIDNINITQLPFECNFAAKGGKMSVYPLCHQTSTGRLIDKYDSFFVIIRVEYEYPGGGVRKAVRTRIHTFYLFEQQPNYRQCPSVLSCSHVFLPWQNYKNWL